MITRIPLTITATASGQQTEGVLVAVLASELDELEMIAYRQTERRPKVSGTCWGRHHRQCSGRKCECECHSKTAGGNDR